MAESTEQTVKVGIFDKLLFTVNGFDDEAHQHVETIINDNGGSVVKKGGLIHYGVVPVRLCSQYTYIWKALQQIKSVYCNSKVGK